MRVTKEIESAASREDVEAAAKAQARLQLEQGAILAKAEAAAKEAGGYRKKAAAIGKDLEKYARVVVDGVKLVKVECEERIDRDAGKVIVRRIDNGKIIEERPYDLEKEEPLLKDAKGGKKAAAARAEASPAPKSTRADGLFEILDVNNTKRLVGADVVAKLRRCLAEGLPCIHAFDDNANVELAMIAGEPVFGVDKDGKAYALTAKQVKLVREAYRARTSVAIPAGDDYVDLVGFQGVKPIGSKPPEKPARGSKKGGSKKGRKSAEARA